MMRRRPILSESEQRYGISNILDLDRTAPTCSTLSSVVHDTASAGLPGPEVLSRQKFRARVSVCAHVMLGNASLRAAPFVGVPTGGGERHPLPVILTVRKDIRPRLGLCRGSNFEEDRGQPWRDGSGCDPC